MGTMQKNDVVDRAESCTSNSKINFDPYTMQVSICNTDRRLGYTLKYYDYKADENNKAFLYFQKIARLLKLLSRYKYPFEFKFKDLSDPKSDLIFLYEGKEVELEFIEKIYEDLKKREEQVDEEIEKLIERVGILEATEGRKDLKRSLLYKGVYKASENEYLNDGIKAHSLDEIHNNERIFSQLLEQYNNLLNSLETDERQKLENSLLVYNSCLYEVINQLVAIPDFRTKEPKELYIELYQNSDFARTNNIFIKSLRGGLEAIKQGAKNLDREVYERLSIVKISSLEEYIQSLISIYDTIIKYGAMLQVPEDMYLYRGIYSNSGNEQENLARSELISTSLKRDVAKKYFRNSKKPVLFMTKVKKGTNFMIIPYQLRATMVRFVKNNELVRYEEIDYSTALENNEVLLFSSGIIFNKTNSTSICESEDREITVIEGEVTPKIREKDVEER